MNWQNIIDIIIGILGVTGTSLGTKSLQNSSKTKDKIKLLEQQILFNQTQFTELKIHISNIENKIDILCMTINNSNNNKIINDLRTEKTKDEN